MITSIKLALVILFLIAVPKVAAQGDSNDKSETSGFTETATSDPNTNTLPDGRQTADGERAPSTGPEDRANQVVEEPSLNLKSIPQLVFCRSHGNNKRIDIENALKGQEMAQTMGWTGADWDALLELWSCESQWIHTAQNPTSTAFGIAQFLDSTWAGVECVKTSDATEQMRCGLQYIKNRYRTPSVAMQFHLDNNWY